MPKKPDVDDHDAATEGHRELDPQKPSNAFHGDRYVVRIYCDNSQDTHVYVRVKHVWFKNKGKTLCILHYFPDGSYRYVMFRFADVIWYQITPERFEQQVFENETQVDR